jgi:hypothetical protein
MLFTAFLSPTSTLFLTKEAKQTENQLEEGEKLSE